MVCADQRLDTGRYLEGDGYTSEELRCTGVVEQRHYVGEPLLVLIPGLHALLLERMFRHADQHHRAHGVGALAECEESAQ